MRFEERKRGSWDWLPQIRRTRRRLVIGLLIAGLLGLLFAAPFAHYLADYRYTPGRPLPPNRAGFEAILAMVLAVPDYYRHLLIEHPDVPEVHIDIKYKHLHRIIEKRNEALRIGFLETSIDDLVPARLTTSEGSVRVKVRLKGDLADHLRGNRWSFRVKVRDGDHVFGMRRFSLQAPYTRGFEKEPLFFDFVRELGILAPRHRFVDLHINGKRVGITALEEHFARELLESQERREGPILKYDEKYLWAAWRARGAKQYEFSNWRNTPVSAFALSRIAASEALSRQLASAQGLVRAVMEDRIAPAAVFDARLWGRYVAACELFNTGHAMNFHNLRMYMNPVSFALEPIAFDTISLMLENQWPGLRCQGGEYAMIDALLEDPEMRRALLESLREVAKRLQNPSVVSRMQERERQYLHTLRRDFPWLKGVDWDELRRRAVFLLLLNERNLARHRLPRKEVGFASTGEADYSTVVYAYLESGEQGHQIEIDNILARPVLVSDLRFESIEQEMETPIVRLISQSPPFRLPPSSWPNEPSRMRLPLRWPASLESGASIVGVAKIEGGKREYPFRLLPRPASRRVHPIPHSSVEAALASHSFLSRDAEKGWLRVSPGSWDVAGWLVVPKGFGLRIERGSTLRFEGGAGIIARGPLEFLGTEAEPIALCGQPDASGQEQAWAGIAVLDADGMSRWSHVQVRGTTGVESGDWRLTGGTTFRNADVRIEASSIEGNEAEDALNLIRSRFALEDLRIRGSRSDALDLDFSEGSIRGGEITQIGGDGIDAGGTMADISRVRFQNVRDKAISAGEASEVRIREVEVRGSGIGLACKDASRCQLADSSLVEIERVALAAYVKKSVFTGAELEASNVRIDARGREALAQLGSRIVIDETPAPAVELDVERFYAEQQHSEEPAPR